MIIKFDTLLKMWREKLINYLINSYTIEGIENSVDEEYIKKLTVNNCAIFLKDNYVVALPYTIRNTPNYQYYPRDILCVNEYLRPTTYNLTVGFDCELLYYYPTDRNVKDGLHSLISDVISTTAEQLTVIDMSIAVCAENTRYNVAICAGDDNDKMSIENALLKIKRGEIPCLTSTELISSGIRSIDLTGKHDIRLSDLTELKQNILSSYLQMIGYSVQNNFKREYVQGGELERNDDLANISGNIIFNTLSNCISRINETLNLRLKVVKKIDGKRVRENTPKPIN